MSRSPASPRSVARQACDICRIRKRKCTFNSQDNIFWANIADSSETCDNCKKSESQCTFNLPSKVRGPKRKTGYELSIPGSALSETDEGQSSMPKSSFTASGSSITSSTVSFDSSGSYIVPCATDVLFSRDLVRFILDDYIAYVYPLIPVIHRPSFKADLEANRDLYDEDFLTLIISLCAVTVGLLPSRFQIYRDFSSPLPFQTRSDMIGCCYQINQSFRSTTYFDTVNHRKWASSFTLGNAFHQIGNVNLWRMLEVESMQLLRLLEVHHVSTYNGMDAIEVQLRKKAFWLMFYGYVHQMYNLRNERLTFLDPVLSCEINFDDLIPAPVDDEYITASGISPCPVNESAQSLTSGFNAHSQIFLAGLTPADPDNQRHCMGSHFHDPVLRLKFLQEKLYHLMHIVNSILPTYRSWNKSNTATAPLDSDDMVSIQRDAIRVNIHTTRFWLQVMILDQIDALGSPSGDSTGFRDLASRDERADICQQLLDLLNSLCRTSLELNGLSLVYKVRDVAVSLLSSLDGGTEEQRHQDTQYLLEFSRLLSVLDVSEQCNLLSLQSWVDTSRDEENR